MRDNTYSAVGDTEEREEHVVVASRHEFADHRLCVLSPSKYLELIICETRERTA